MKKKYIVTLTQEERRLLQAMLSRGKTAVPVPAAPGQVAHYDYEYVRNGVANIFMISEPLAGQREVEVTDRQTKMDYALCLRKLYPSMSG